MFRCDIKTNELIIYGNGVDTSGKLIFNDNDNTNNVQISTPTNINGSYTFTLPENIGTDGYVLQTNESGVLSWVAKASPTVLADDIVEGPTNVEITTSSGNITTNVAVASTILFNNNDSTVATISSDGIQQSTTSRLILGTDSTTIYSSSDGRMDIIADTEIQTTSYGNIYFEASTGANLSATAFVSPEFIGDNALQFRDSNNYIYSKDAGNLNVVTVNTLNMTGNSEFSIRIGDGNSAIFNVGDGDQLIMTKNGSINYLNMTSTAQESGIGLRNNDGQLEFKPNTNQGWQPMIGFPKSIVTVSTDTVVSIPTGTVAINIKAVAAGGGGGGTNSGANQDNKGTGGGGGGGQFGDIYIDSSNIGGNTAVYIEIGAGGTGSSNTSAANGGDGGNTVIKLVESGSNSGALVTLEGGEGGYHDADGSAGGLGGSYESGLSNCIGYVIPGGSGEGGYDPRSDNISRLTQGNGGMSHMGAGGRIATVPLGDSTVGLQGGGGAGAHDEKQTDGTDGGDGFAAIIFY